MKRFVACLVGLIALLGFATASMANHSIAKRGTVHMVDYGRHVVVLADGTRYRAADDVDLYGLTPGTDVIVYFHRIGGRNTVVSYEYADPAYVVYPPARRTVVVPQPEPTVTVNPGPGQVVITPEPSPAPTTVITSQPGPAIIRAPSGAVINPQPGQTIISSQPGRPTVVQPQYGEAVVVPQTGGTIRVCPAGAATC